MCKKPEWFQCDNSECVVTFKYDGKEDYTNRSDKDYCNENFIVSIIQLIQILFFINCLPILTYFKFEVKMFLKLSNVDFCFLSIIRLHMYF